MELLRTEKEIIELFDKYSSCIFKISFLYMKNVSDAEDIVQSTFIKLMEYQGSFANEKHEKAWLIVTASNLCKDQLKHWWRRNLGLEEADEVETTDPFVLDETLQKVLKLPKRYKTPIYMYYYEGYNSVEIAKILNMKEATVRSHLHTGRKLLKLELEGEYCEA